MRLYHGTVHEFDAPDPGMGREATDFGVGFYATDSERRNSLGAYNKCIKSSICLQISDKMLTFCNR